jgi:NAD-dependent SIR2 family protein deacetylase
MKGIIILAASISLIAGTSFAAKPAKAIPKTAKKAQKTGNIIARYDKNNNGFIDADEVEAIQKAFGTDAALKQFDKNGDGKLDDIEVSAMNPQPKKKKK